METREPRQESCNEFNEPDDYGVFLRLVERPSFQVIDLLNI